MNTTKDIKGILIGSSVLLAVVSIIAIIVYFIVRKNKKTTTTVQLPNQTDWGQSLTADESNDIKRIADELYNDLKGINFIWMRNPKIYQEYSTVSDRVFIGVANYFAEHYGNGESLTQWLKDESFSTYTYQLKGITDSIIKRLEQNGIH